MPITSAQFTLSNTTATQIVPPDNMPHSVVLHNHTKSSNEYIHIGPDSSVGTANSIHIDPGQTIYIEMDPEDELWAVSDPNGLVVGVLDTKRAD